MNIRSLPAFRAMIGILLVVMIGGYLFAPAIPAAAAATEKREPDPASVRVSLSSAIKTAKLVVPQGMEMEVGYSELTWFERADNMPVWEMFAELSRNGQPIELAVIVVDAMNGDLLSVETAAEEANKPAYSPNYTRKSALSDAQAFVRKAVPSLKGVTLTERPRNAFDPETITPLFAPGTYSFAFELSSGGIPIYGSSVHIRLNAAGSVEAFVYEIPFASIASPDPKISVAEAERIWKENMRLGLVYALPERDDESDNGEPRLFYQPYGKAAGGSVDAVSGDIASQWDLYEANPASYESMKGIIGNYKPSAIDNEGNALKLVNEASFVQGLQWKAERTETAWRLETRGDDYDGYATVESSSGRLLDYHLFFVRQNEDSATGKASPRITTEAAVSIADRWMADHVPGFADGYGRVKEHRDRYAPPGSVVLDYQRMFRGIPVLGSGASVTVDGNGKISDFRADELPIEESGLAALVPSQSADEAMRVLTNAYRMKLVYVPDMMTIDDRRFRPSLRLYYITEDLRPYAGLLQEVDAVTGLQEEGDPHDVRIRGGLLPAEYRSHPLADALQLMLDHGVIRLDQDGKTYPDKAVSRIEFWEMMEYGAVFGKNVYVEDEPSYSDIPLGTQLNAKLRLAIEAGWLKANASVPFNPEGALTREQLAVWLTSVIGQRQAAAKLTKDASVAKLKDAGQTTHRGEVALMMKLGFMTAAGGKFRPRDAVTLAELAETFRRLAIKQAELGYPIQVPEDFILKW